MEDNHVIVLRSRALKIIIMYILEDSGSNPNTASETGGCGGWWHLRLLIPSECSDIRKVASAWVVQVFVSMNIGD